MRKILKESPATGLLVLSWIILFIGMMIYQGGIQRGDMLLSGISASTGLRFGAQRIADLMAGQYWRPLTASFVHFSIGHIALNALGLLQLGALLESWYGARLSLALYVFIAIGGNLLAAGSKFLLHNAFPRADAFQDFTSGGGSVVLVGYVAMLAVVGWRSRSRFGDYVRAQMLGILAFTALLGLMIPQIDNFGHAGGAVMGALAGFGHRRLLADQGQSSRSRAYAAISLALILAAFALQYTYGARVAPIDRAVPAPPAPLEERYRQQLVRVGLLRQLEAFYHEIGVRGPRGIPKIDPLEVAPRVISTNNVRLLMRTYLSALIQQENAPQQVTSVPIDPEIMRLVNLALEAPPSPGQISLFRQRIKAQLQRQLGELQVTSNSLRERREAEAAAAKKTPASQESAEAPPSGEPTDSPPLAEDPGTPPVPAELPAEPFAPEENSSSDPSPG